MNDEQPPTGIDPDDDDSESRAALAPFAAILGSAAVWAEPPAELEALVLERVRVAAAPGTVAPARSPARTRSAVARWVLPAVAAAAAVAFAAGFVIANRDDDGGRTAMADVELVGTELAPDASASGEVVDSGAGYAITIRVEGLPPAPEGEYYEGWVQAPDGAMVSVGTFHMRSGDDAVVLWSGVKIGEYSTLIVSEHVEREPMDTALSVLLAGPIQRFET